MTEVSSLQNESETLEQQKSDDTMKKLVEDQKVDSDSCIKSYVLQITIVYTHLRIMFMVSYF